MQRLMHGDPRQPRREASPTFELVEVREGMRIETQQGARAIPATDAPGAAQ